MNMTQFLLVIRRLFNYEPLTPLRMLRASAFGQLVCVKGTVVRVSSIRPLCTRMAFKCLGCSHTQSLSLQQGKYATPTKVHKTKHRFRFWPIFKYLHVLKLMYMHVFIVWSAWMSESFFHALSEFSHHKDRRLAGH